MINGVQSVSAPKEVGSTLQSLVQLTKPRITQVVLSTALCGALMAPGSVNLSRLVLALFATAIVVGSANALNMYLERESDAAMERTRNRPLPSGRLAPEVALWFGISTGAIGIVVLAAVANLTAAALAGAAWFSYVFIYTPLKPISPMALYVGAVPGALPPLIGWAAMTGELSALAWGVFGFLFVWQIPHFLAIAVFRRNEYVKAGLRVMPAVHGVPYTKRAVAISAVAAVLASLVPYLLGEAPALYLVVALVLGAGFVAWALSGFWVRDSERWARWLFIASLPYLILVYGTLVAVSA